MCYRLVDRILEVEMIVGIGSLVERLAADARRLKSIGEAQEVRARRRS